MTKPETGLAKRNIHVSILHRFFIKSPEEGRIGCPKYREETKSLFVFIFVFYLLYSFFVRHGLFGLVFCLFGCLFISLLVVVVVVVVVVV